MEGKELPSVARQVRSWSLINHKCDNINHNNNGNDNSNNVSDKNYSIAIIIRHSPNMCHDNNSGNFRQVVNVPCPLHGYVPHGTY